MTKLIMSLVFSFTAEAFRFLLSSMTVMLAFLQVSQVGKNKEITPTCPKCNVTTTFTPCEGEAMLLRGELRPGSGYLLMFKHTGKHSCNPVGKKGKAKLTETQHEAILDAIPNYGPVTTEKLKIAATANVFNKMLLGQDSTTLEDVLNVSEAVQDVRALNYVIKGSKSSKYTPESDPDVEIRHLKERLQQLGLRALLFDRYALHASLFMTVFGRRHPKNSRRFFQVAFAILSLPARYPLVTCKDHAPDGQSSWQVSL